MHTCVHVHVHTHKGKGVSCQGPNSELTRDPQWAFLHLQHLALLEAQKAR